MHTFAPTPTATRQTTTAQPPVPSPAPSASLVKSTLPSRAHVRRDAEVGSILHLQHTIGNQAVQRLVRTNAQELNAELAKGDRVVQRQPKKGRVIRVERPRKARPKPPGPGAYTEEELRNWYKSHPDAKTKYVDMINGKRTQDEKYTPDTLWVRGYTYALTNVFGNSGTEVWLNSDDKGKVIGIEREIP
jgi:hypothetical protein